MHRIGFYDTSKGPSGPSRYFESILSGLDRDRFEPVLFGLPGGPYRALAEEHRARFVDVRLGSAASMKSPLRSRASLPVRRQRTVESGDTLLKQITRLMLPAGLKYRLGFQRDVRRLAAILHRYPVDLFHTNDTGCEESPLAARRAGYPIIVGTFHVEPAADVNRLRDRPVHRRLERRSNRALDLAIAVSEATRSAWIERSQLPAERVITIHNGIQPDHFRRRRFRNAARAVLGIPQDNSLVIGAVGRLDAVKGFEYLIKALARVKAAGIDVRLVVAGEGPQAAELRHIAHWTGAMPRTHFVGYRKDVQEVLDALDLFVLPSLSEALPYALLEAMATDLPCVATDVGGVAEALVPGETGYLVPPRNALALANAITELAAAPRLREQMGQAARERVLHLFNEEDMVRSTIEVYESLLAQSTQSENDA